MGIRVWLLLVDGWRCSHMYVGGKFLCWFPLYLPFITNKLLFSFQNHMDPFEELGMTAQNAEQHRRSATEKQVRLHDSFLGLFLCCVYLWFPYTFSRTEQLWRKSYLLVVIHIPLCIRTFFGLFRKTLSFLSGLWRFWSHKLASLFCLCIRWQDWPSSME